MFGDGGTSTQANPTHTYQADGQYTAHLTVSDGENSTVSDGITIRVGNPPNATILTPADGHLFQAGETINYSGERNRSRRRFAAGERILVDDLVSA